MEMVLVVVGVLAVLAIVDRQRHQQRMRLKAERVRAEQLRRRRGGSPHA